MLKNVLRHQEIETPFTLLSRLYTGTENLEKKTATVKRQKPLEGPSSTTQDPAGGFLYFCSFCSSVLSTISWRKPYYIRLYSP